MTQDTHLANDVFYGLFFQALGFVHVFHGVHSTRVSLLYDAYLAKMIIQNTTVPNQNHARTNITYFSETAFSDNPQDMEVVKVNCNLHRTHI